MANVRDIDVALWGATGFTGTLATAYLAGDKSKIFSFDLKKPAAPKSLRYALCGRNKQKLEALKYGCNCPTDVQIFVADADDFAAIEAFVKRTRVVCAFAGPFRKYSDLVVQACVKHGTHFVDICGEPQWVRSCIDRFQDRATATGACIVNMCGYDSIPSDLGALFAVRACRNAMAAKGHHGRGIRSSINFQFMGGGGFSGGSLQTGILADTDPVQLTAGVDPDSPFLLGGERACGLRDEDKFCPAPRKDERVGMWVAPFAMEKINALVVRRSCALLNYGDEFNYQEVCLCMNEKQAGKMAKQVLDPIPTWKMLEMIEKGRLPKPGEGPPAHLRKISRFLLAFQTVGDDGTFVNTTVSGGEAGYEETAKMAVESALTLALNPTGCPGYTRGGFQTPASCMGFALVNRLHAAGILFKEVRDAQQAIQLHGAKLMQLQMETKAKMKAKSKL